jgi:hypothetical protein
VAAETGFYALDTSELELARVAAVARHVPDAVVYVRHPNDQKLFEYHGIPTVVPQCGDAPSDHPMTPRCLERWLVERNPSQLVVDSYAYGRIGELRRYVQARSGQVSFLAQQDTSVIDPRHFRAIVKTEPCAGFGQDLYPLLAFEPSELPTRVEARRKLGAGDRPIVLIIGEGTSPNFTAPTIRACDQIGINHVVVTSYPVQPLMVGADLIVGYAGHYQVEAEAVGVEMLAVQNYRDYRRTAPGVTFDEIREALTRLAAGPVKARTVRRTGYTNRARRAAALIAGDPDWKHVDG